MALPPKKYYAPSELICQMLAETLPKISSAEEYLSLDFAKRLIDLQERKRKSINSHNLSDAFPWLYQLGFLKYKRVYLPRGGWTLMLYKDENVTESVIRSVMRSRHWVLDGKWYSAETQEAVARGENPHPPFVPPPDESEIRSAKEFASVNPKPSQTFSEKFSKAIEDLPSRKRKKKKKDKVKRKPEPDPTLIAKPKDDLKKAKKTKKKCCDNPHVVRSKKTGKRWCKNCGAKYKPKAI